MPQDSYIKVDLASQVCHARSAGNALVTEHFVSLDAFLKSTIRLF
jgi:hypothetical protein